MCTSLHGWIEENSGCNNILSRDPFPLKIRVRFERATKFGVTWKQFGHLGITSSKMMIIVVVVVNYEFSSGVHA